MHILFATGIYPPDIGGPATYCVHLAEEFSKQGHTVTVLTYGNGAETSSTWNVYSVSKSGGPLLRWIRYAQALKAHGKDVDIIYAFSSVSCGIPLILAGLKKPKKILRLGGDFFWERYTDRGGRLSLRAWYEKNPWSKTLMKWILNQMDHIVFSTEFQKRIYHDHYAKLPAHSVVENARTIESALSEHLRHEPFRILSLGRLVGFKNLEILIEAMADIPNAILTVVGDGPRKSTLQNMANDSGASGRIVFVEPLHGTEKHELLQESDLMVVSSVTDISPNAALEASASGLPVLITQETGLSESLTTGMIVEKLETPEDIASAIQNIMEHYPQYAVTAQQSIAERTWEMVMQEHIDICTKLIS